MVGKKMTEPTQEQEYWAWYDNKDKGYRHIYPRRFLVEMCSPDGFKRAEARGDGRIVKVVVKEVCDDRTK